MLVHRYDPIRERLLCLLAPPSAANAAIAAVAPAHSGSDVGVAPMLDQSGKPPIVGGPVRLNHNCTGGFGVNFTQMPFDSQCIIS